MRSRIRSRSNSASAPKTWKISLPPLVVVSSCSVRLRKPIPRSSRSVSVAISAGSDRPSRSSRQTASASPGRRYARASPSPGRSALAPLLVSVKVVSHRRHRQRDPRRTPHHLVDDHRHPSAVPWNGTPPPHCLHSDRYFAAGDSFCNAPRGARRHARSPTVDRGHRAVPRHGADDRAGRRAALPDRRTGHGSCAPSATRTNSAAVYGVPSPCWRAATTWYHTGPSCQVRTWSTSRSSSRADCPAASGTVVPVRVGVASSGAGVVWNSVDFTSPAWLLTPYGAVRLTTPVLRRRVGPGFVIGVPLVGVEHAIARPFRRDKDRLADDRPRGRMGGRRAALRGRNRLLVVLVGLPPLRSGPPTRGLLAAGQFSPPC